MDSIKLKNYTNWILISSNLITISLFLASNTWSQGQSYIDTWKGINTNGLLYNIFPEESIARKS